MSIGTYQFSKEVIAQYQTKFPGESFVLVKKGEEVVAYHGFEELYKDFPGVYDKILGPVPEHQFITPDVPKPSVRRNAVALTGTQSPNWLQDFHAPGVERKTAPEPRRTEPSGIERMFRGRNGVH